MGLSALLEYALGSSPSIDTVFNHLGIIANSQNEIDIGITHAIAADDVILQLELSDALNAWTQPPAELIAETRLPGGQTRQTWRVALTNPDVARRFVRLLAVQR